jgi:hypothetical protein
MSFSQLDELCKGLEEEPGELPSESAALQALEARVEAQVTLASCAD